MRKMQCKCGCGVELVGRQSEFATEACRSRSRRNDKSVAEYTDYFKNSHTLLRILEAGPEYPVSWGSCCACGRKFTQEGFEKVIVCSTCFHKANDNETETVSVSSLQEKCVCRPTEREEDCSVCKRLGVPCTHQFYWCAAHGYHSEQYCQSACA